MLWWLVLPIALGFLGYFLRAFAQRADDIEDDSRYLYQHRHREAYGSKFLNILTGRDGK